MNKLKKTITVILTALPVMLAAAAAVIYITGKSEEKSSEFHVPPFEAQATDGVPDTGRDDYRELKIAEDFTVSLCTSLTLDTSAAQTAGKTDIYFTSHPQNRALLRIFLYDSAGNGLYSSGLIRPGEYLKTAELYRIPEQSGKITVKILSYEPDTYYSAGTAAAEVYLEIN